MNKITQITIKKREKNQHFSFISTQPRHKLNRRVGLNCTATYVISTIVVACICIRKKALMKQNNGGENMNILATWKNDIDQPDATERLKQCYGEFGVKYTTVLHDSV